MNMTLKESLLNQLNEASFAMDEAVLFLDTHPNNAAAMQYYREAVNMRNHAMEAYERQFGPLTAGRVMGNCWDWVTEK